MNPQWQQQQQRRQQLPPYQQFPQPTGFGAQSSFDLSLTSQPTGSQPDAFRPPLPPSFPQAPPAGFAEVAQPTRFGDPPMSSRMMPSPTFMPADTSMPYGTGFNPGSPKHTQGSRIQQSMQRPDRKVGGGPEIPWAPSEDERRSDDATYRSWNSTQGTGFISDRRLNGAPIPTVLPQEPVPSSEGYPGDSHVAQPTRFSDPPMSSRMMPSPPFKPTDTSMPYGTGFNPGPPQHTQGPSLQQQSMQRPDRNVGGSPKIPWAPSEDERRRDDPIYRRGDSTQGTGFKSGRRLNEAPTPTVLPQEPVPSSESYLGDSHVAQPTRFGDPPMSSRTMPSPTFMPADTSMPYGTGFNPGSPQHTQGPSLQQSMQRPDRNVGGSPEIPWAPSEDERRSDDPIYRRGDSTQGTGFKSGRRLNEAPTPTVLPQEPVPSSESYPGDSHVAQPTGFGDPSTRTTFTPTNTSMPYRPRSTSQSAGPPKQAQGPSSQRSMHHHHHSAGGGSKVSWALSKMQQMLQQIDPKRFELPQFDLSQFDLSQFDFSQLDLSQLDLSQFALQLSSLQQSEPQQSGPQQLQQLQQLQLQQYQMQLVMQQNADLANSISQMGASISDLAA